MINDFERKENEFLPRTKVVVSISLQPDII